MKTANIHEFGHVIDRLGIDVNKLGCVMLPVEPFDVFGEGRDELLDRNDLYFTRDPGRFWINGDVARNGGHVTLLYGLLQPAWHLEEEGRLVTGVMAGWSNPHVVHAEGIEIFESPFPDEPYGCVVAKLNVTHELADAHARLSYLPHVDTYPDYTPHVTLAYVKREQAQDWADILSLAPLVFETGSRLDLGKRSES